MLVLTTSMLAAGYASEPTSEHPTMEPPHAAIAQADQANLKLALPCILLGSGMVYLFRPIRRIPIAIRS